MLGSNRWPWTSSEWRVTSANPRAWNRRVASSADGADTASVRRRPRASVPERRYFGMVVGWLGGWGHLATQPPDHLSSPLHPAGPIQSVSAERPIQVKSPVTPGRVRGL